MQQRVALVITAVWSVILLLFGGYVWMASNQEMPAEGNLQREVEQLVFWGGGTTAVTITHAAQPNLVCPPQQLPTNIVLLIDRSGSMSSDDRFPQALSAAQAFVEVVDIDRTQIAIAFFDTNVEWLQPNANNTSTFFSQDRDALFQAIEDAVPPEQASTIIENALDEAGEAVLAENRLVESQMNSPLPVIILLSDGEDTEAKVEIESLANQLHEEGVRIITIGLGLSSDDEALDDKLDLLRNIASSSTDMHEKVPENLVELYRDIAEEFNNAVAFDITYRESVNPNLQIIPQSQQPLGQQLNNQLQWEQSSMTQEGLSFQYAVATTGLGRYTLNAEESSMSYTDCIAGPIPLPLAAGPDLLTLPEPLPFALLAFLPFLIPAVLMFWRRKPDPAPMPTTRQRVEPPPAPPKDQTPEWLKRLNHTAVLAQSLQSVRDQTEVTPTVIIGLGLTGRTVLNQVARTLRTRYGGQLPSNIRLLQIDIQPKGSTGLNWSRPKYLVEDEWVLLEPDLGEMKTLLQSDRDKPINQYLRWYEPYNPSGRMQGRMSIYYDLRRGSNGSLLWSSLHKTVHELLKPKIRVVGSTFDDASSGLLIDVARLTQIVVAGSNPENSNIDVELWLTTPVGQDWSPEIHDGRRLIRSSEQETRTMATLRELERFQRNARQPFIYVPDSNPQDQLRTSTHSAVIQTIFLFEPRQDVQTVDDHLNVMADSLLAVLPISAQQELTQHLTASQRQAGVLANVAVTGTACSLGAYAVRLPLGAIEEAAAWRATYELLFERLLGVHPCREQQPNGLYIEISAEQATPDHGRVRRQKAEELVEAFESNLDSRGFMYAVARQVTRLVNGEEGEENDPILNRRGGLLQAQRWLESVRALVRREGEQDVVRRLNELLKQLEEWQALLQKQVEPLVKQQWQQARNELSELITQKGRRWILDEQLEWALYQRHVRTSPNDHQTLKRAGQRFGWQVQYKDKTKEWQFDFLVPPVNFVWSEDAYLPEYVVPKNPHEIMSAVYHTAVSLTQRTLQNETVLADNELQPSDWIKQAEPGFNQGYAGAQTLSSQEMILFVAPEAQQTEQLRQSIADTSEGQIGVRLCTTNDQTAMTLLRVQGHMPLNTYHGYTPGKWETTSYIDPNLYVWRGEQIASERESKGKDVGRLDAKFVGWIQLNQRLLDLFCQSYIYGLWDRTDTGWFLPGLGAWPGKTLGDALENLFGNDTTRWPEPFLSPHPRYVEDAMVELEKAVTARQAEIAQDDEVGGARGYLRRVHKEQLPPLQNSSDSRERNFALYLAGFLEDIN